MFTQVRACVVKVERCILRCIVRCFIELHVGEMFTVSLSSHWLAVRDRDIQGFYCERQKNGKGESACGNVGNSKELCPLG